MEFEKYKAKRQKTLDLNVAQGGGQSQALPVASTSSSSRRPKVDQMGSGWDEVKFKPNENKWTPKKMRSQTLEMMGSAWDDFKLKPTAAEMKEPRIQKLKQENSLRKSLLKKVASNSLSSRHAKVEEMGSGWDDFKLKPNETRLRSQALQVASPSSSQHAKVEEMGSGWDNFKFKPNDTKWTPKETRSQTLEEMDLGWVDFKFKPNEKMRSQTLEEMGSGWDDFKLKPNETMWTAAEMKHPSIQKLKEENALQMSLLKKPPKTYKTLASSMLMKPLAIHEWPTPKAYNGKSLIYYGSVDDSSDDDSDNEDADVDVVGLSDVDSEEEDSALSDFAEMDVFAEMDQDIQEFIQKMVRRPVERFCMGNLPPMPPPIVHHPVEDYDDDDDDFEDDDDDWDETNDEGYEDMTTEEEDNWEEKIEEKPLVPYPNCLGPCALIERIVGSDIDRTDALDRIVDQL